MSASAPDASPLAWQHLHESLLASIESTLTLETKGPLENTVFPIIV
ncbi:hypothetical protein [Hymenobacter sp. YC55]|nr:hypothetical protein [Hymenobacter sp. YC55]MDF7815175.1 hypothetical protein [Hymenobacter sp. YC55]